MEILNKIIFTSFILLPLSYLGVMLAYEVIDEGLLQDIVGSFCVIIMLTSILAAPISLITYIWLY